MKKLLSIFGILILSTAFLACDFGSDDEDSTTEGGDDTYTEGDEYTEDDTYTDGYENDWELVMIIDAEENTSGGVCNAGNPGADIDAVEVYRDGMLNATAISVEALEQTFQTPCPNNDKDDPDEMLGQQDGVAEDGVYEGYFSLDGRSAYLLMSDIMENGDSIVIYEMRDATNPEATIEDYQVYLGYYTDDGEMAWTNEAVSDWATGVSEEIINGLW